MNSIQHIPNFFLVGAAKAGTTSVYNYLSQHPEVYLSPVKEPNHFCTDVDPTKLRQQAKERIAAQDLEGFLNSGMNGTLHRAYITNRQQYLSLFSKVKSEKAIGEASVSYLYSSTASEEIFKFNPAAKIIIVLRNPTKRAYSHYLMDRKLAFTELNFEHAFKADQLSSNKGWGATSLYYELGLYYEQVQRYLKYFPKEQVLILLHDDLISSPNLIVNQIFEFLGVNTNSTINFDKKHNSAAIPRNKIASKILGLNSLRVKVRRAIKGTSLQRFIKKVIFKEATSDTSNELFLSNLKKTYDEDINKLSQLINRDLSKWH